MKKISLMLVAVVLMFGAAKAFSQTPLEAVISAMAEANAGVNNLEASYEQVITFDVTGEKQVIEGNLKYLKPSYIYIVQHTPQEQQIYIDGKNIIIYTPANKQAVLDSWPSTFNVSFAPTALIDLGTNYKQIAKENNIKYLRSNEDFYIIEISPKKDRGWTMEGYISKQDLQVKKAVVLSHGVTAVINIREYKTNQDFNIDMFKFKAPQGVDIIKLN